jgi:hypothetical protein
MNSAELGRLDDALYPALLYGMLRLTKLIQNASTSTTVCRAPEKKYHRAILPLLHRRNTDWASAWRRSLKRR